MTMTKPTSEQVTFTAAGSGATLRNLVDKVREVVSVKDFGAVGDGVADDTAAIQAALNHQQASGVALDFGGSGLNYKLTTWSQYSASADLVIRGTGATITGKDTSTPFIKPLASVDIRGCRFTNMATVIGNATTDSATCESIVFADNEVDGCYRPIAIEATVEHVCIANNEFIDCRGDAVRIGENTYADQDKWKRMHIRGNTVRGLAHDNFDTRAFLVYGKELVITDNIIDGITGNASYETHGIYTKCRFTEIVGNVLKDISTGTTVTGIEIKGSGRTTPTTPQGYASSVVANTITGTSTGIRLACEDVIAASNMIDGASANGIDIVSGTNANRVMVIDNVIYGTNAALSVGIRQIAEGELNRVAGNIIGNFATGIRVSGTSSANVVQTNWNCLSGCGITYNPSSPTINQKNVECIGNSIIFSSGGTGIRADSGRPMNMVIRDNTTNAATPISFSSAATPFKLQLAHTYHVDTTGSSTNTVFAFTLAEESTALVESQVMAKQDITTDNAAYWKRALATRDTAGAAALVGALQSVTADLESAGASSWSSDIAVASNDVRVRVVGATSTNINWSVMVKMQYESS